MDGSNNEKICREIQKNNIKLMDFKIEAIATAAAVALPSIYDNTLNATSVMLIQPHNNHRDHRKPI